MHHQLSAGLGLLLVLASPLGAQSPARLPLERPAPQLTLTLDQALAQGRSRSPAYRQVLNDAGPASAAVRSAYGQLVPRLGVGGNMGYFGEGKSTFGGSTFTQTSPSLTSGYGIQVDLGISGATLLAPGTQRANQRAVEEDIAAAGMGLNSDITAQFLTALQAGGQADVARQQVKRNTEFLELARARFQLGQATLLDVRQAEVTKGQSDVQLLQAVQVEAEAKLELFRRMGTDVPGSVTEVALADPFTLTAPALDLAALLRTAEAENPSLRSLRAREDAAAWTTRAAKSQYLPSLSASAAWQGYTQQFTNTDILLAGQVSSAQVRASNCAFQNALIGALPSGGVPGYPNGGRVPDCNAFAGLNATGQALDPAIEQAILDQNSIWPFRFNSQPFRASVQVSLPLFQGFSRNLDVARASAAREDAEEAVRARELQVRTEVQARFLAIDAAWQAIAVQSGNRDAARDQLQLTQERFRLGNGSALEVTDAQSAVTRAEADYVNAVYAYHKAITALEFAVGRPLR